ncbi:hypothetical protein BKA56DRAFT_736502 [Ilyonectria sp. MPI-CAGE-AT-0026]|nr:hypothetical protein BKA56DRAFT_736502 [Ilyonectria sp. MPI-CAGE-AT-0026]
MEGTIRNWGDTVPAMTTILAYCRSLFKVTPKYGPPETPENMDDNNGGGYGATSGEVWTKQVKKDDYGGYFYLSEGGQYQGCDSWGNDIQTTDKDTGYRTSNPRGIVLVFANADNPTYYYLGGVPTARRL